MDYEHIKAKAATQIAKFGKPVTFYREGSKFAKTSCVALASSQADDPASLLAQTAQKRLTLLVAPTKTALQAGDTLLLEKQTYTITKADEFRPGTVTLYVTLEVI